MTLSKEHRANIEAAIKETEYKYFGMYEFTESQHDAVSLLVSVAQAMLDDDADELKRAALAVEKWWVEEGKNSFDGAPACMFALRSALSVAAKSVHADAEGQRYPAGASAVAEYKDAALTELLNDRIELNMSNYNEDDVSSLNEWAIRAYAILAAKDSAPSEARGKEKKS